ncbi:hypothetical protein [Amycolatopsis sp. MEPSY49]|uniref:hypothetical protein n=1 Tax=Amycolatopsis sp. MEPSY49 TaxID=3151600 RepID=UPI003EF7F84F
MSYRKNPHGTTVAAITDGLQHYFGADEVFIDNGIPSGDQYPNALESQLQACSVLLVMIHEGWEDTFTESRHKDWVLHEVKTALDRGIHVIPVPIGNAAMPAWEELPAEIGELANRQVAHIRSATYAADLDRLIRQLENHVAPAAAPVESSAPRRKRLWLRLLVSTISLFALTPVLFHSGGTAWEFFARPAAISTALLALVSTVATTLVFALQPLTNRWEKGAGANGIQRMFRRYWIVPFLIILSSVFTSIHAITEDQHLRLEKIFSYVAFFSLAIWVLWLWYLRMAEREEAWPPPVTTEPVVFRRAAHRLEQRLIADGKSRKPFTKADRRDAESILSGLDGAREELDRRAGASIPVWLKGGHRSEAVAYLSWFGSVVALELTAIGISVFGEPALGRSLRAAGLTLAIAIVFTAAALYANRRLDRRDSRRWSSEIAAWQQKLTLMIPAHGAPAERGHG